MLVLNFYSPLFIDQLRKGRKTATIRLGDKSHKYRKGEVVLVTVGYQHSPRERIFEAVVDSIEVKRLAVGKTVTVTVRGTPFVLEVGAGANAKGVAEAFEQAKAPA